MPRKRSRWPPGRAPNSRASTRESSSGRLADIIVVNVDRPHLRPLHRAVSALVYSARGSDVETTIVDGRIVYQHGRCLLIDEDAAVAAAQSRAEQLVARAGMAALCTPRKLP